MQRALAEADRALQAQQTEIAESRYRDALVQGWLLLAMLDAADGKLEDTAAALERVEKLRATAPADAELAFTLGSGYLRLGRVDLAEKRFAEVLAARPGAPTLVLIGRTYRDFEQRERAAAAFAQALAIDPAVRHAHYYLGTLALLDPDGPRLDEAIGELGRELDRYPDDEGARLYLGMALVESKRFDEALAPLEAVARGPQPYVDALFYLGRCLLGLDRAGEAIEPLRRALSLAGSQGTDGRRVQGIEYQLALALRRQGSAGEAAEHFAAAERLSAGLAARSQERLASYLRGVPEREDATPAALRSGFAVAPLATAPAAEGAALRHEVETSLARASMNLAVIDLHRGASARAAEQLATAAALDPGLPGVDRALGIARFNAGQRAEAIEPLRRAIAREPGDAELRRLIALSYLETGLFAQAAHELESDPQRASDPALEYAYALALVRNGQPRAAQEVFARLLRDHADWPQLHVLLGQAHAAENDYEAAVTSLEHALALSPTVPEAHLTLGSIYLRQGKLDEAEGAFRAELASHSDSVEARYQLATALDLAGKGDEAVDQLAIVLAASPRFADARYLLGKMLLARGDAARAAEELSTAAELAPRDANIRYQLGQAYQKLGRGDLARRQFDLYRELKHAAPGGTA